jgi:hypothetical protein
VDVSEHVHRGLHEQTAGLLVQQLHNIIETSTSNYNGNHNY